MPEGYSCSNVIYFPYINVPDSVWMTHVFLYWDKVYAIVPRDFLLGRESLSPAMREMVDCGLVEPRIPGEGVNWAMDFDGGFTRYVGGLGQELQNRRTAFKRGHVTRVHGQKVKSVFESLRELGLAGETSNASWVGVERNTARDFMGYLATSMASNDALDASPVTDDQAFLTELVGGAQRRADPDGELAGVRNVLLTDLLPIPSRGISPAELADFKQRHGDILPRFRRRVELAAVDVVNIGDPAEREYKLGLVRDDLGGEATDVAAAIAHDKSAGTRVRSLWADSLSLAGYVLPPPFSVIGWKGDRMRPQPTVNQHSPMLYAAYALRMTDRVEKRRRRFTPEGVRLGKRRTRPHVCE